MSSARLSRDVRLRIVVCTAVVIYVSSPGLPPLGGAYLCYTAFIMAGLGLPPLERSSSSLMVGLRRSRRHGGESTYVRGGRSILSTQRQEGERGPADGRETRIYSTSARLPLHAHAHAHALSA